MADLNNFDANTVEPATELEPLPAGEYLATIVDSEFKPTKSGTGRYLQLTFQILEGAYQGRFAWARLNLENPNPTTVKIARAELSAICRAVGVMTPKDSVELHNLPLIIALKLKKRQDTGELGNEIKGYAAKTQVATPAPQATGSTPPWRRP